MLFELMLSNFYEFKKPLFQLQRLIEEYEELKKHFLRRILDNSPYYMWIFDDDEV